MPHSNIRASLDFFTQSLTYQLEATAIQPLPDEDIAKARKTVCANAIDAEDAKFLLTILDIMP